VNAALDRWSQAASWKESAPPSAPAPSKDSRIGIPERAVIFEESEGYRKYVLPEAVKPEAAPQRPSPPRPQAFTLRKPAPPAPVHVEKEPDPFDVTARVLETADEIPF